MDHAADPQGQSEAFLSGGGEMGRLMRAHDWAVSPVGAPEGWPQSLRTVIRLVLTSNHPMFVFWGPDHIGFYNDAYSASIGPEKHPAILGAPGKPAWAEIWHIIGPQIDFVLSGKGATWNEDRLVPIIRHGGLEEVYWTYGYSPIDDAAAPSGIGGVLVVCTETTAKVLAERRAAFHLDLDARLRDLTDPHEVMMAAAERLGLYLQAGAAGYAEIDAGDEHVAIVGDWSAVGFAGPAGDYRLDDYSAAIVADLRGGHTVSVADTETDPRTAGAAQHARYAAIGARAFINAPLAKAGRVTALLYVLNPAPRAWTQAELALVGEVGQRTWAAVERARTVTALRASQKRQQVRIELRDRLRELSDPEAMMQLAADLLGPHLVVDQAAYYLCDEDADEIVVLRNWTNDITVDLRGRHRLSAFGDGVLTTLKRGRVVYDQDTELTPAAKVFQLLNMRAVISAPLVRDGRLVAGVHVGQTLPRAWTADEASLVQEVGDRIWAAIEQTRAVDALRRLNETLEQRIVEALAEHKVLADVVETTDAMIQVLDLDFGILAINKACADELERVYGITARVGDNLLALLVDQPEHQAQIRATWGRALAGEAFTTIEDFGDPERDRPYYEIKFNVLRDRDGRRIGAYHLVYDITERLRNQAHLERTEEALRQSQKLEAIGQLTGGVAHDFNNLLTIIRSSADLLRRPTLNEERRRRYVDAISDTADRAAKLTGQLLAFARRQALTPRVFDVSDCLEALAEMLRTMLGARITLNLEIEERPCLIEADVSQFETALVNLAVNANDAMNGEGEMTMRLAASRPGSGHDGMIAVSIADSGCGIAADALERVFEPFFTTKAVGRGTGLGLSQVYGFASQSGGEATVVSQLGHGATFTLHLPRTDKPLSEPSALGAAPDAGGQGRVLVVEDNANVGEFSTQLLNDLGYQTTFVANAEDALRLLDNDGARFDLVFSDVVMPGMDGVALGHEIQRRWPGLPVVLTSGYSHVLAADGGHGFELLRKPYSVESLSHILRRVLSAKGDRKPVP